MSNGRILVVDDEPQILRAVQMKLRSAGYAVDTAATAQEALMKAGMRPLELPGRSQSGSMGVERGCSTLRCRQAEISFLQVALLAKRLGLDHL